ncbi:MAG: DUF981 family protein [Armatimonadota bacterium]
MFVDYITLLLVNMTAGHVLLAAYVYRGLDEAESRNWAPGFGMVGLVATAFGTHMTLTWPIIGAYNSAFGEMSVLFGVIFLGAAFAMAMRWSLLSVAAYAFFAGLAAALLGVRMIGLGMTQQPLMSGAGFILSGLGGILAAPTLGWLPRNRALRTGAAVVLLVGALIWAFTCYMAYWGHMESFGAWLPATMREAVSQ